MVVYLDRRYHLSSLAKGTVLHRFLRAVVRRLARLEAGKISGSFKFRATKVGADTTLSQIVKLVQSAQSSKAPAQRLADRAAHYLVLVAVIGGLLTFLFWYVLAGADLVMSTGYFADQVRAFRTMKGRRVQPKGFLGCGNGAFSDQKFVKELGDMTEYVMDGNYQANPRSPLAKKMYAHYKKLHNAKMPPSAIFAYEAIHPCPGSIGVRFKTSPP